MDLIYSKVIKNDINKPWLVMVHGFTHNHKYFKFQIPAFTEQFNILLVDLRGHGNSDHIGGPYGIEEYTDDLESIIEHYEIEQFFYWGTHTGAAVGLVYSLRHPKKVLGLILEGVPLPGYNIPRIAELIERAKSISVERNIEEAKKDWFENADWFGYIRKNPEECRAGEHIQLIDEFKGNPWIDNINPRKVVNVNNYLREFDMPMLLYNGDEDLEGFLKAAQHMGEEVKQACFRLLPNAGGFPCWENPKEVNKLVSSFLEQIVH